MLNATRTARTQTKRPANTGRLFYNKIRKSRPASQTRDPACAAFAACPSLERALI